MRHIVLHGGRGSAKSHTIARYILIEAASKPTRILCAREFQNSIKESVIRLLTDVIIEEKIEGYEIFADKIVHRNGSELNFKGIKNNVDSIKSLEGYDICWIEEAHNISQRSLDILWPTFRKDGSFFIYSYNPNLEDDPIHQTFVANEPPPRSLVLKVSWRDNPWFPEVLKEEKDYLFKVNPDKAMHVWEGECRSHSDAQIFKGKWTVRAFEIDESFGNAYYGTDWGFSTDPHFTTKSYIKGRNLYIRKELVVKGLELDDMPNALDQILDSRKDLNLADNARPETISMLKNKGFNIKAAKKWKGSVQEGIDFLLNFEKIIIHTECPNMADEAKNYSYRVDKVTGKVLTDIVDDYNHGWDSLRYAFDNMIRTRGVGKMSEDFLPKSSAFHLSDW